MFTTTTEYALRAAVYLASHPGRQTALQVATATKVPQRYMAKVLQLLVEAGVTDSQRGPAGGFTLRRPAREVTALQVVQAVEPLRRIRTCPLDLPEHCPTLCPLHQLLDNLSEVAEARLGSTSIADLISKSIAPLGVRALGVASSPRR